ncbi:hypothetical protein [Streptomyces sp. NPDC054834]
MTTTEPVPAHRDLTTAHPHSPQPRINAPGPTCAGSGGSVCPS